MVKINELTRTQLEIALEISMAVYEDLRDKYEQLQMDYEDLETLYNELHETSDPHNFLNLEEDYD